VSILRAIIEYFTDGIRPIRAVEGIGLATTVLILSYFIFFYELNGFVLYLMALLSIVSYLAFIHIRGCRGFYEMFLYELETLKTEQSNFHRLIIFMIRIFEYYLIIFSIFCAAFFISGFFNYLSNDIPKLIIGISAISYVTISFIGHTTRLSAIKEIRKLREKNNRY